MADILIIRGGSDQVVDALAAVGDVLANVPQVQVDLAVPADTAAIAKLSGAVRRVVSIAAFSSPDFSALGARRNWKAKFWAAAKTVAAAANENLQDYRAVAKELRLVRYDLVFDLDASAFSVAVARAAKADKIIGFNPSSLPSAAPGAALLYHEVRTAPPKAPPLLRCRHLLADYFNYEMLSPPPWNVLVDNNALPVWMPQTPFILVGDKIPAPFWQEIQASHMGAVVGNSPAANVCPPDGVMAPATIAALAKKAVAVVGNGLTTAIAAAVGAKTLFIGAATAAPFAAVLVDTPTALKQALADMQRLSDKTA